MIRQAVCINQISWLTKQFGNARCATILYKWRSQMNKVAPTPISKSSYTVTYDLDGLQTFQLQAIETLSMTQNGEDDLVFH